MAKNIYSNITFPNLNDKKRRVMKKIQRKKLSKQVAKQEKKLFTLHVFHDEQITCIINDLSRDISQLTIWCRSYPSPSVRRRARDWDAVLANRTHSSNNPLKS